MRCADVRDIRECAFSIALVTTGPQALPVLSWRRGGHDVHSFFHIMSSSLNPEYLTLATNMNQMKTTTPTRPLLTENCDCCPRKEKDAAAAADTDDDDNN